MAAAFEAEAEVLRALGHPTRLALLALIAAGEQPVGAIEAASGISQPGLSQQLAVLRKAGLVATRRAAKQIYYRIDPAGMAATISLLQSFGGGVAAGPAAKAPRRPAASAAMFAKIL
ncbi:MAG TPA: metalloregulator ArsR/SmtB family transcription factor [Polymorphobacter sp.]|nr:metalloregulator ArsR/SmtB family transcription factor [Polymorphobacter sp.]